MTLPETDPPGERAEERRSEDPAAPRGEGAASGRGFRVEPRSSVPARTALAPRTDLAPRTGLSPRASSEPRRTRPAGSPDRDDAGEDPSTAR